MADVNDTHAALAHALDHAEQVLSIDLCEAAGRLVHDEHARFADERAGDLDELLLGDGERPDRCVEWHLRLANFLQRALGQAAALAVVDPTKRRRLAAKQDVFLHRQIGREVELLINHRHAAVARVQRIAWLKRLAVEREAAGIRPVRAAEHFHQRAFACTVFTDERVNFPGGDLEAHAVERNGRPEALGHPVDSQAGKRGVAG